MGECIVKYAVMGGGFLVVGVIAFSVLGVLFKLAFGVLQFGLAAVIAYFVVRFVYGLVTSNQPADNVEKPKNIIL